MNDLPRLPLLDLRAQHAGLHDEIMAAVGRVVASGRFVQGPEVARFEADFAKVSGTDHAACVNSGTSALHLALLALGIGPGDEVITAPMTFVATTAAIGYVGAKPVFVDVDPRRWTLDPGAIEAAITPRTKALMPVHLHGLSADMDPIMEIARHRGLKVIEDAAQSHAATYRGRPTGSFGDAAAFSFYPGKNLGALGEGGALVTNDPDIAASARLLRDWGAVAKYRHVAKGYNYRMDELQAAVLSVKLARLDAWNDARRRLAERYDRRLAALGVEHPVMDEGHVYHVYAVTVPNRDAVAAALQRHGIDTGIHYPIPVHLQPAYAELGHRPGSFPVSERLAERFLSLPLHPELTPAQVDRICDRLHEALHGK